MLAYKFLREGRVGQFSGLAWPEPGVWVRVPEVALCRSGIHACRPQDLPWWLADELWEVELDGEVSADYHKIVAPAGRLRAQLSGWTVACARTFADACAWRARDRAVQALRRAGHEHAGRQLAGCLTLEDVLSEARRLSGELADTRIALTIAGDGARRALSGAAPTSAYIAAHAAGRLDGPAGHAAERDWQASWLIERLGLRIRPR
jgi:hypothetical protein